MPIKAMVPYLRNARGTGLAIIAFSAMLPLLALAVFAIAQAVAHLRPNDDALSQQTARSIAAVIDAQMAARIEALQTLAAVPMLGADRFDATQFEERARLVGTILGGWIALGGPPPDYTMLANTLRPPGRPLPETSEGEIASALAPARRRVFEERRPGVSDVFAGTLRQRPVFAVIIPVRREGQPDRGLALMLETRILDSVLAQVTLPLGSVAAVRDGASRTVAFRATGEAVTDPASPDLSTEEAVLRQARSLAVAELRGAPGWTVAVGQRHALHWGGTWRSMGWLLLAATAFGLGMGSVAWAVRQEAIRSAGAEAEALERVRHSVARLHAALPAVIFLRECQPDGGYDILYRGGDLERVLGWSATAIGQRDISDWAEDAAAAKASRVAAIAAGGGVFEWRIREPDGGLRWLRTELRVLERRADGSSLLVGYIVNVDAERTAQASAAVSARLAALGEMAVGLAHELKQPLQIIAFAAENAQHAAQAFRADPAPAEQQRAAADVDAKLRRIIGQSLRAGEVIEHLRRFALGRDEGEMPHLPVRLDGPLEGALLLVGASLRAAGIQVESDLGAGQPPVVLGETVAIEQVLVNLLQNARDALGSRPHSDTPHRIEIRAEQVGETVRVIVSDTGGGIPRQVLGRLFEPFITTKGRDRGTGLGLSICQGLVQAMGGTIEAHNGPHGAVFTMTLQAAGAARTWMPSPIARRLRPSLDVVGPTAAG